MFPFVSVCVPTFVFMYLYVSVCVFCMCSCVRLYMCLCARLCVCVILYVCLLSFLWTSQDYDPWKITRIFYIMLNYVPYIMLSKNLGLSFFKILTSHCLFFELIVCVSVFLGAAVIALCCFNICVCRTMSAFLTSCLSVFFHLPVLISIDKSI